MEQLANIISGLLVVIGASFAVVAAIGILRFPDIFTRMHAASKAGTLGSGLLLLALAIHAADTSTTLRAFAGIVFLLLTAPISAHLLAKAAYSVGYRMTEISVVDELDSSEK